MSNPIGLSRNEAILANILGADYEILPPFSRIEVLLLDLADELVDVANTPITSEEIEEIVNDLN